MHILIREILSFNLMYVTACYPVGTTISKTSSLFTALLQHYKVSSTAFEKSISAYTKAKNNLCIGQNYFLS